MKTIFSLFISTPCPVFLFKIFCFRFCFLLERAWFRKIFRIRINSKRIARMTEDTLVPNKTIYTILVTFCSIGQRKREKKRKMSEEWKESKGGTRKKTKSVILSTGLPINGKLNGICNVEYNKPIIIIAMPSCRVLILFRKKIKS